MQEKLRIEEKFAADMCNKTVSLQEKLRLNFNRSPNSNNLTYNNSYINLSQTG